MTSDSPSQATQPLRLRRRAFLRRLGKGSLGMLVTVATLLGSQGVARAHGYHVWCCHLAKPPQSNCIGNCLAYVRYWYCDSPPRLVKCMECQSSEPSCWTASTYYCSDYAVVG